MAAAIAESTVQMMLIRVFTSSFFMVCLLSLCVCAYAWVKFAVSSMSSVMVTSRVALVLPSLQSENS